MASGGSDEKLNKLPKIMNGKRSKKLEKDRQHFLLSRRHPSRSSVRPFLCCGSQISLNSIPDLKDFPVERDKVQDDDYEDLTDSDEHADEHETVQLNTTFTVENISKIDPNFKRGVRIPGSKHKKAVGMTDKNSTRKKFWALKLRGKLQVSKGSGNSSDVDLNSSRSSNDLCVCTSYTAASTSSDTCEGATGGNEPETSGTVTFPVSLIALVPPSQAFATTSNTLDGACGTSAKSSNQNSGARSDKILPFVKLNELYPINDIDEQRIAQRRREMERGIEVENDEDLTSLKEFWKEESDLPATGSAIVCSSSAAGIVGPYPTYGAMGLLSTQNESLGLEDTSCGEQNCRATSLCSVHWVSSFQDISQPQPTTPEVHTQVDYKHYLVPDIDNIVNSSFYWGVMDRYQAEKLIENKPEGTFLLRDSAQDEFLFSVSFRRYGRSLHARIEQWNHKFSFDSRDPGVFATDTVCGLIEHYLDPSCCMFFEPMLTRPLHRTFPFSLQHLSRAVICRRLTYDTINKLTLPKTLKEYLRFYHYKQKVRVRRFDNLS